VFLEESFQSFKEYLKGGNSQPPLFDAAFVRGLDAELRSLVQLCERLDKEPAFVQRINDLTDPDGKNPLFFKTAHFFLSDAIATWEQLSEKATERSAFVLACYYDVLRNTHFPDAAAVGELNRIAADPALNRRLAFIRTEHRLPDPASAGYFLSAATADQPSVHEQVLQHYSRFIDAAFGLKFKQGEEAAVFFKAEAPQQGPAGHARVPDANDTLEKVLEELDRLTGLENVKKDVRELINVLEVQKKRSKEGLKNIELSLHTVFLGPPGTGKTSVARLLGRIYRHLGFLSKGQFYETDREGLIAGYVGQTAAKVDKAVEESLGGVLFIDEAYALTQNVTGSDYGSEAVNTLLKRMEDHRDNLAVVVAGYTEPMKLFVESNPGLRSRFSRYFYFDHFKPSELMEIFLSFCERSDFTVGEDAQEKLQATFDLLYEKRDEGFGNARVVRNLFEKCTQNQANRIVGLPDLTQDILKILEEDDIPEPKETADGVYFAAE
jgi:hypothetical protein